MSDLLERLSPREREVVELIADGLSNKEIGEQLGIAERSVKQHVRRSAVCFGITDHGPNRLRVTLANLVRPVGKFVMPANVTLTPKQQTILGLLAKGQSNVVIGLQVEASEGVIKNHLRIVFDKLGVWSRAEAASWYRAHCEEAKCPG